MPQTLSHALSYFRMHPPCSSYLWLTPTITHVCDVTYCLCMAKGSNSGQWEDKNTPLLRRVSVEDGGHGGIVRMFVHLPRVFRDITFLPGVPLHNLSCLFDTEFCHVMCNYWVGFNDNIVDADVDAIIATSSGDFSTGIGSSLLCHCLWYCRSIVTSLVARCFCNDDHSDYLSCVLLSTTRL